MPNTTNRVILKCFSLVFHSAIINLTIWVTLTNCLKNTNYPNSIIK